MGVRSQVMQLNEQRISPKDYGRTLETLRLIRSASQFVLCFTFRPCHLQALPVGRETSLDRYLR